MKCDLCPRKCLVDRKKGEKGICGQTENLKVARAALHFWEEPCISGDAGSGAVFFSGCPLHCVFCQNENIANGTVGKEISLERLVDIFLELQEKRANNINLVTPGHFVPQIVKALDQARKEGLTLPVVYNTSSYETVDTIKMLEGYVDIYLPDFKYMSPVLSKKYSRAPDYAEVAKAAIAEMVRLTGRTGRATTEHVHFETRINGQHFNPNLIFDLKERTLRKECIKCTKNGSKIVVKTQIPDNRIAQNKK